MGSLFVILVILGCAAYQYSKGTAVKAFAMLIISICSVIAAFGYFELLAGVLISRGDDDNFAAIVPWAQTISFILLFISHVSKMFESRYSHIFFMPKMSSFELPAHRKRSTIANLISPYSVIQATGHKLNAVKCAKITN